MVSCGEVPETQIVTFRWMPSFIRGLVSILMNSLTSTSRFLSLVLRHRLGIVSMQLDPERWGAIDMNSELRAIHQHVCGSRELNCDLAAMRLARKPMAQIL